MLQIISSRGTCVSGNFTGEAKATRHKKYVGGLNIATFPALSKSTYLKWYPFLTSIDMTVKIKLYGDKTVVSQGYIKLMLTYDHIIQI